MATETSNEVAVKVKAALLDSGLSKLAAAEKTGIPYSTLNRKLGGHVEFTFDELFRIASVTGVRPSEFVPRAFLEAAA